MPRLAVHLSPERTDRLLTAPLRPRTPPRPCAAINPGCRTSRFSQSSQTPTRGCICKHARTNTISRRSRQQLVSSAWQESRRGLQPPGNGFHQNACHLQWANRARLQPARDAVQVEDVSAASPRNRVARVIGQAGICGSRRVSQGMGGDEWRFRMVLQLAAGATARPGPRALRTRRAGDAAGVRVHARSLRRGVAACGRARTGLSLDGRLVELVAADGARVCGRKQARSMSAWKARSALHAVRFARMCSRDRLR
jgi:hypothetical protein